MQDFSRAETNPYRGLRRSQVDALVSLLRDEAPHSRDYIARRYKDTATHFQQTTALLLAVGALEDCAGQLRLITPSLAHSASYPAAECGIWDLIFATDSKYRRAALEYLRLFRVLDGRPAYRPASEARSSEGPLRNFLLELGVIGYDRSSRLYFVSREHIDAYAAAVSSFEPVPPSRVEADHRRHQDIGRLAERAVLAYERSRVGPRLRSSVDHVAIRNAAAGYDIRSVTVGSDGQTTPRFIEVKAVPRVTYRFFWSANEQNVAHLFGSWYHLYLVPCGSSGTVELERLLVLPDPCANVLSPNDRWLVEAGVLECQLDPRRPAAACVQEIRNAVA